MVSLNKLKISNSLIQLIQKLPPSLKQKIRSGLDDTLKDPHLGKPLREELLELWSLRVGNFRIIYKTQSKIVEIITIGPRSSVYQEALRFLKK